MATTHIKRKPKADHPHQQAERPAQRLDNRVVPIRRRFFEPRVQVAQHAALDNIAQPRHDDEQKNP
jgi:hypothetical protein